MLVPLSLKDFYGQTLKQAGFTPPEDSIEKFAAANKLDLETTKIASAVFEQLQLDGVAYDTPQDMFQDALKIAHSYMDHCKEVTAQAEKLAGDLHRVARHAVEGYLAQHGVELDADEGVKIAGLQARSFQELTQKQAELRQLDDLANSKFTSDKTANPIAQTFRMHDDIGGQGQLNPAATKANIATQFGLGDKAQAVAAHIDASVPTEQLGTYADALHEHARKMPNANFTQVHDAAIAASKAPAAATGGGLPGMIGRNPGTALGVGALGLGALYLMKKKREEREAAMNRQRSIIGAAGMPAA